MHVTNCEQDHDYRQEQGRRDSQHDLYRRYRIPARFEQHLRELALLFFGDHSSNEALNLAGRFRRGRAGAAQLQFLEGAAERALCRYA